MMNWIHRRKLVALVEKLAIYNDKGIEWAGHDEQQVGIEREKLLSKINHQVNTLGKDQVSTKRLDALSNGSIKTDITEKYIECAKQPKL